MAHLTTIDMHVAGEPLRIITSGFPEPAGKTILEKRKTCQEQHDHIRRAAMWEPRGHTDMYGCLIVAPCHPEADVGVLFFHNEGYSTMCGHGILGLTTAMLEHNLFPCTQPKTTIRFETPSGLVTAIASVENGKVSSVAFRNVPSFAVRLNQAIDVPKVGTVSYDLASGGAFYAFCSAKDLELELIPQNSRRLKDLGMAIKNAIMTTQAIQYPTEPDLGFLYGIIFVGTPQSEKADFRHVCIFADGALDRSPTGTGVSAHLALLHAKGKLATEKTKVFESILGTKFTGSIVEETTTDGTSAIITEIKGQAYLTGKHEFLIEPNDPLKDGFLLK